MIASAFTLTIVRAVRSIMFLQNVVYPSMLECSDADGSATAVMAYLDVMLNVVDDRSVLVDVVVGYLVGAAEGDPLEGGGGGGGGGADVSTAETTQEDEEDETENVIRFEGGLTRSSNRVSATNSSRSSSSSSAGSRQTKAGSPSP